MPRRKAKSKRTQKRQQERKSLKQLQKDAKASQSFIEEEQQSTQPETSSSNAAASYITTSLPKSGDITEHFVYDLNKDVLSPAAFITFYTRMLTTLAGVNDPKAAGMALHQAKLLDPQYVFTEFFGNSWFQLKDAKELTKENEALIHNTQKELHTFVTSIMNGLQTGDLTPARLKDILLRSSYATSEKGNQSLEKIAAKYRRVPSVRPTIEEAHAALGIAHTRFVFEEGMHFHTLFAKTHKSEHYEFAKDAYETVFEIVKSDNGFDPLSLPEQATLIGRMQLIYNQAPRQFKSELAELKLHQNRLNRQKPATTSTTTIPTHSIVQPLAAKGRAFDLHHQYDESIEAYKEALQLTQPEKGGHAVDRLMIHFLITTPLINRAEQSLQKTHQTSSVVESATQDLTAASNHFAAAEKALMELPNQSLINAFIGAEAYKAPITAYLQNYSRFIDILKNEGPRQNLIQARNAAASLNRVYNKLASLPRGKKETFGERSLEDLQKQNNMRFIGIMNDIKKQEAAAEEARLKQQAEEKAFAEEVARREENYAKLQAAWKTEAKELKAKRQETLAKQHEAFHKRMEQQQKHKPSALKQISSTDKSQKTTTSKEKPELSHQEALCVEASKYFGTNPAEAYALFNQALREAEEKQDHRVVAMACSGIADYHNIHGNKALRQDKGSVDWALTCYEKALESINHGLYALSEHQAQYFSENRTMDYSIETIQAGLTMMSEDTRQVLLETKEYYARKEERYEKRAQELWESRQYAIESWGASALKLREEYKNNTLNSEQLAQIRQKGWELWTNNPTPKRIEATQRKEFEQRKESTEALRKKIGALEEGFSFISSASQQEDLRQFNPDAVKSFGLELKTPIPSITSTRHYPGLKIEKTTYKDTEQLQQKPPADQYSSDYSSEEDDLSLEDQPSPVFLGKRKTSSQPKTLSLKGILSAPPGFEHVKQPQIHTVGEVEKKLFAEAKNNRQKPNADFARLGLSHLTSPQSPHELPTFMQQRDMRYKAVNVDEVEKQLFSSSLSIAPSDNIAMSSTMSQQQPSSHEAMPFTRRHRRSGSAPVGTWQGRLDRLNPRLGEGKPVYIDPDGNSFTR